jgi:hypothetical protein
MSLNAINFQFSCHRLSGSPVPTIVSATRAFSRRGLARPRDILDYGLFLPCVWLVSALGASFRLGGPLILLAVLALWIGYALLRCSAPPKWLGAYVIICIVAAILSHYRIFPESWQVHFRHEAIARQLAPLIVFFIAAWASKAYFERRLLAGDAFAGGDILIFLALVAAPVSLFQQGFQYEGADPLSSMLIMYGSLNNNIMIAMFYLTAGAFAGTGWRRLICIIIILVMLSLTSLAQFWIVTAGILMTLLGFPGRLIAFGIMAALLVLYMVGFFFIPELMTIAPNSGIRLVFIVDAFKSVFDTFGAGIGFGLESVRWRYNFPSMPEFTFLPEPSSMTLDQMLEVLSTGVHNSLIQALLRTGVLGFAVLVIALFSVFPRRNLPCRIRNHAAINFVIIFIACFVNPALESPLQGIGGGIVYGYLIALRAFPVGRG